MGRVEGWLVFIRNAQVGMEWATFVVECASEEEAIVAVRQVGFCLHHPDPLRWTWRAVRVTVMGDSIESDLDLPDRC